MSVAVFKPALLLLALAALSGCANLGKPYSQIDPAGAQEDIRQHNGYYQLTSVTPGMARLLVRSDGGPRNVTFSINSAAQNNLCSTYTKLAVTRDAGRGVLYPWIANLTESTSPGTVPFFARDLAPGKSVIVQGEGSWHSSTIIGGAGSVTSRSGRCGPRFSQFTPQPGHAYLVEFTWSGDSCSQSVIDATNPDAPVPMRTDAVYSCQQP